MPIAAERRLSHIGFFLCRGSDDPEKQGLIGRVPVKPLLWYDADMSTTDKALVDIENRNRLRAEGGLPLLDARAEATRLAKAREQALFENYFQQERHRFVHLWADRSQNFWTKMGTWNAVRKKLREEMQTRHD